LAETSTGIAHCPCSNMRLGSGIARIPQMLKDGIPVGLAVDGSASNDASDMMGEMRACLLLHRVLGGAEAMTADQVLTLATRGGARLLGWPEIGSLEVGQAADVVLIEMNRLDYAGALCDPLAAIMFCGISHNVHTVIVNGREVLKEGRVLQLDEEVLRDQANEQCRRMLELAGHSTQWML
jgi:cytosine/adenosine deaminase-related metal-dependent hydrolase